MAELYELGVIGAGNMAEGILKPLLARDVIPPEKVIVSDPSVERRAYFAERFGITAIDDNRQAVARSRMVMLAVKPQVLEEVAAGFADAVTGEHVVISILAGVVTGKIAGLFPSAQVRVVRVMPNLPIHLSAGTTGICRGAHAGDDDLAAVVRLFDAGGATVVVEDEGLIDAITAVSGSGPAYFYYFVENIVAGGVSCGLSEEDALKLAAQTCLGAARMMLESGEPPAELRSKVTSKGGTTQAALEHMDKSAVGQAIRQAVQAAFLRARELGS